MDSVTQFLLGAAIGDGLYRKKIGKSAKWWGGIAGTLPDLDIFFYRTPLDQFTIHRGYSHSLLCTILGGLILGWIFHKFILTQQKRGRFINSNNRWQDWCGLFVLGLVTHPLLDVFTSYGTQLMLPFNNHRYALHGVGIVDPFYTGWLLIALIIGAFIKPRINNYYAQLALIISTLYLGYGYYVNQQALKIVRQDLMSQKINYNQIHCYPTLFQPYLRNIVVQADRNFYVSTISMWQQKQPNPWQIINKITSPHIEQFKHQAEGKLFRWFSDDQILPQQITTSCGQIMIKLGDMRYPSWNDITKPMWGIEGVVDASGYIVNVKIYRDQNSQPPKKSQSFFQMIPQTIKYIWSQNLISHIWSQAFVPKDVNAS